MARHVQLRGDPVHVMVIHEGIQLHSLIDTAVSVKFPADGMGDLEIVVIIVSGIQPLMQFIVGYGIQHLRLHITAVIAVDHLAHQPEIFLFIIGKAPHILHKGELQTVRAVQADAVDIKLIDPETDHVKKIFPYLRLPQIQIHKFKTVPPGLVSETVVIRGVPPEVDPLVPAAVGRVFPVLLNILECEKLTSCVVEHAVHHHPDIQFMRFLHKFPEIFIVSQPSVHQPVISRIISVRGGFKQGTYIYCRASDLSDMRQPFHQALEPVRHLCLVISPRRPCHTDRIHMIKHCFFKPFAH